MKNSLLKRKMLYALNQELITLMKSVKNHQELLILALNDEIKYINENDKTMVEISRIDFKRQLNRYISIYSSMLEKQKVIDLLKSWEFKD